MADGDGHESITARERETWDRVGENWLHGFAFVTEPCAPLLIEAASIEPGMRVLDAGCGAGNITALLAQTGASLTGFDLAPGMVAAARKHFPDVEFLEANAEDLPLDDGLFDAVTCCYVAHHFAHPDVAFGEFVRVLKPEGRFVFAHPAEMAFAAPFFTGVEAHHTPEDVTSGPLFGAEDPAIWKSMIVGAGFAECSVQERIMPYRTDSYDVLMDCFRSFMPPLPEDTWNKIWATSLETAESFRDGEELVFNNRVLLGVASKA